MYTTHVKTGNGPTLRGDAGEQHPLSRSDVQPWPAARIPHWAISQRFPLTYRQLTIASHMTIRGCLLRPLWRPAHGGMSDKGATNQGAHPSLSLLSTDIPSGERRGRAGGRGRGRGGGTTVCSFVSSLGLTLDWRAARRSRQVVSSRARTTCARKFEHDYGVRWVTADDPCLDRPSRTRHCLATLLWMMVVLRYCGTAVLRYACWYGASTIAHYTTAGISAQLAPLDSPCTCLTRRLATPKFPQVGTPWRERAATEKTRSMGSGSHRRESQTNERIQAPSRPAAPNCTMLPPLSVLPLLLSLSVFTSVQGLISAQSSGSSSAVHMNMACKMHKRGFCGKGSEHSQRDRGQQGSPGVRLRNPSPVIPLRAPLWGEPRMGRGAHHVVVSAVWSSFPP